MKKWFKYFVGVLIIICSLAFIYSVLNTGSLEHRKGSISTSGLCVINTSLGLSNSYSVILGVHTNIPFKKLTMSTIYYRDNEILKENIACITFYDLLDNNWYDYTDTVGYKAESKDKFPDKVEIIFHDNYNPNDRSNIIKHTALYDTSIIINPQVMKYDSQ